ncbi:MAG: hypothetical protein ACI853_002171 [Paracoccaceae bacterium]
MIAEQALCCAVQVQHVVDVRPHAPQNAENHLDKERRLDPTLIHKPRKVIKVTRIITLEFEFRAMGLTGAMTESGVWAV